MPAPSFSATRPVESYRPRQALSTEEFKTKLKTASDASYPKDRNSLPHYDSVLVLLLIWDDDGYDLKCQNELSRLRDAFARSYGYSTTVVEIVMTSPYIEEWLYDLFIDWKSSRDLLIVYYAGHGYARKGGSPCLWASARRRVTANLPVPIGTESASQTQVLHGWVDFTKPRDYLCSRGGDVLFLLDCCHATGTAIGGGKELIAACAVERETRGPGDLSFMTALVQELEHGASSGNHITAAMLYGKLLQKTLTGSLEQSPIHAELSPQSRLSIYRLPQGNLSSPTPATWPNNILVSVTLQVQLRDGSASSADDLTTWLTRSKPSCAEKTRVQDSRRSTSYTLIIEIPVEVWYCLLPDMAIRFISFRLHPSPGPQTPAFGEILRDNQPPPGSGHGRRKTFGGYNCFPGAENGPSRRVHQWPCLFHFLCLLHGFGFLPVIFLRRRLYPRRRNHNYGVPSGKKCFP